MTNALQPQEPHTTFRHRSKTTPSVLKRRLVWHRNKDLRFHDHPFYEQNRETKGGTVTTTSQTTATTTTSVFVFDDAFGCGIRPSTCLPDEWKAVHLGPHGMRVLLESVRDLRFSSQQHRAGDNNNNLCQELIVRRGPTIPVLMGLLEEMIQMDKTTENGSVTDDDNDDDESIDHGYKHKCEYDYLYEVCWNEEPGWHEKALSEALKVALTDRFDDNNRVRVSINTAMSCTLYHPDDLPSPGEWQPMSKKEKRRRKNQNQKQRNNNQQQQQQRPNTDNASFGTIAFTGGSDTDRLENSNTFVDVSPHRWAGMPRIMGDFRKIAREKAEIRESHYRRHHHTDETDTDIDTDRTLVTHDREEPPPSTKRSRAIDPGPIPSLEDLLEPLLVYLGDETETENGETQPLQKKKQQQHQQPILGLPASIIRDVCTHSLRIYHRNLELLEKQQQSNGNEIEKQDEPKILGGESAGLKHLDHFVTNHAHTAQRSLACVENHQSSRLSHYLAFGCLSPRRVVAAAEAAIAIRNSDDANNENMNDNENDENQNENGTKNNDGTWLISHMTMRDFFLYTCLASGERFYRLEGIPVSQKVASSISWKTFGRSNSGDDDYNDDKRATTVGLWTSWATGTTGLPLVDAAMAELVETGYCSNRVRQNAASVLTKDLKLDWRAGAEWFQFLLEDHCVGANWGNWLYFSGVGPDPKNRHFCTVSQALKYDPTGEYVTKWIPSLRNQPPARTTGSNQINTTEHDKRENNEENEYYLRPWDFDPSWRRPLVDSESQYTWRDLQRLKETGRLLGESPA